MRVPRRTALCPRDLDERSAERDAREAVPNRRGPGRDRRDVPPDPRHRPALRRHRHVDGPRLAGTTRPGDDAVTRPRDPLDQPLPGLPHARIVSGRRERIPACTVPARCRNATARVAPPIRPTRGAAAGASRSSERRPAPHRRTFLRTTVSPCSSWTRPHVHRDDDDPWSTGSRIFRCGARRRCRSCITRVPREPGAPRRPARHAPERRRPRGHGVAGPSLWCGARAPRSGGRPSRPGRP